MEVVGELHVGGGGQSPLADDFVSSCSSTRSSITTYHDAIAESAIGPAPQAVTKYSEVEQDTGGLRQA